MRMSQAVAALALTCVCVSAGAAWDMYPEMTATHYFSGQELHAAGRGSVALSAFAIGVKDADASNLGLTRPYCVPKSANIGQVADVVWKYLDEHPAKRHLPGAHLVRESFRAAWPCGPL